MALPNPGLTLEPGRTALVLTDLQNDFLSPGGNGWALFAESYGRLGTVGNLEWLRRAAKASNVPVLIRKRRVEKAVVAGPAGNLRVEAHFRDLPEHGGA